LTIAEFQRAPWSTQRLNRLSVSIAKRHNPLGNQKLVRHLTKGLVTKALNGDLAAIKNVLGRVESRTEEINLTRRQTHVRLRSRLMGVD
jgi:hypothetical protein